MSVVTASSSSSSVSARCTISRATSFTLSLTSCVDGSAAPSRATLALFSVLAISPVLIDSNISSGLVKPASSKPFITALKKSIILSNSDLVVPTTFMSPPAYKRNISAIASSTTVASSVLPPYMAFARS